MGGRGCAQNVTVDDGGGLKSKKMMTYFLDGSSDIPFGDSLK